MTCELKKEIPVGLAPMAGFTDKIFRLMCAEGGADFCVTEMVSAAALCYRDGKTPALAERRRGEAPCAVQIFGHDPAQMAEAAEIVLDEICPSDGVGTPPAAIEINMGCPVKKIVKGGDGSALMREPVLASKIVRAVSDVTAARGVPLWVKIRAGWDKNFVNAPEFAAALADAGAARITVHGRTRDQMYAPSSDNGVIRRVRKALDPYVEVFGNGDVTSGEDAARMIKETGCDGVLVGRAALGDPWIFGEIKDFLSGGDCEVRRPTKEDRIGLALRLLHELCEEKGEGVGVRESRARVGHLIRGIRGSAAARWAVNRAVTEEEFEIILTDLLDQTGKGSGE